jgi:quinoprotein relay system zinc metallohydrolase 1
VNLFTSKFLENTLKKALFCAAGIFVFQAHAFDYQLKPRLIAKNTYLVQGATEDFSAKNGGNIVNTAFIVTSAGVVVIDTGPTKLYGEQLRTAIAKITNKPIARVFITHPHPDHFLGSQAFKDVGIFAVPKSAEMIAQMGNGFTDNMFRMVIAAASGTESVTPTQRVTEPQTSVGEHTFTLLTLTGHTPGDLAILDTSTGVLFAGDIVFNDRTPATPHASIAQWLRSLDTLQAQKFSLLVSGHGAPTTDAKPIAQTRAYLRWLDATLTSAAAAGKDMSELLATPAPPEFSSLAVFRAEFERSLAHLYPRYEAAQLR